MVCLESGQVGNHRSTARKQRDLPQNAPLLANTCCCTSLNWPKLTWIVPMETCIGQKTMLIEEIVTWLATPRTCVYHHPLPFKGSGISWFKWLWQIQIIITLVCIVHHLCKIQPLKHRLKTNPTDLACPPKKTNVTLGCFHSLSQGFYLQPTTSYPKGR